MFNINDIVKHSVMGICTITDIQEYNGQNYYILNRQGNSTKVMIPTDNKKKMLRSVLSKEEIDNLIKRIPSMKNCTFPNFREKNAEYDKLLRSGSTEDLIKLLKTLYSQRTATNDLTELDKKRIKIAEGKLYEEFGYSLNIEPEKVKDYILSNIKSDNVEKD